MYQGSETILGQAYQDLLEAALSTSLDLTPVYHRENWKLFTLQDDDIYFLDDGQLGQYCFDITDDLASFRFLYNQILNPTLALEREYEFYLQEETDAAGAGVRRIRFATDPFHVGTEGGPIDGVPSRPVEIETKVHTSGLDGSIGIDPGDITTVTNEFRTASYVFTSVDLDRYIVLLLPSGTVAYRIIEIESESRVLLVDNIDNPVTLTFRTAVSWRLESREDAVELAFWIPAADIDRETLADNFGVLVRRFEPSSENYKALIAGIFRYFLLGPALERIEAALNIVTNVPVVREDVEILESYTSAFTPSYDRVVTDQHAYLIPLGAVRLDIQDPANWGELTLQAFEPLSTVFTVTDYIEDPTWWWSIQIPDILMPDDNAIRRTVTPLLYPLRYGETSTSTFFGDLGIYYGADDDGTLVPSGMARPPLHHNLAYHVMNQFAKYHTFGVSVDPNYDLPRTQEDLLDIIDAGKPSYTYMFFQPVIELMDEIEISESGLGIDIGVQLLEEMPLIDTNLMIGDPVVLPSFFVYSGAGIDIQPGVADPSLGETQIIVGGTSPFVPLVTSGTGWFDWPAQITIT